ncbi:hypothetical protein DWX80_13340 [Ruminococcus sp. AF21-3]|nr:hypothetical protein DWX80_13340 [Ruminococcus sp. AF21-3]
MTKIKNTKKGMAKKTLSMSLVVAMLATSNVPVWAAEFSDGTDAAVATELRLLKHSLLRQMLLQLLKKVQTLLLLPKQFQVMSILLL